MDLNNGWRWFWTLVVVTYLFTILLELPFIAWCLRGSKGLWRRSLKASVVLQSASYVVLFGWYWLASGTSLYTQMRVVPPSQVSLPESVVVYFISAKDGDVWRRQLSTGAEQRVLKLRSTNQNDRLLVRADTADPNHWDLLARLDAEKRGDVRLLEVLTNLAVVAAPDWRDANGEPPYENTWFAFGAVPALGCASNSYWKCWSGFYPVEGLRASNETTKKTVRLSYETLFGAWTVRNAVLLPGDKVLFQLGDDQICVFDPGTRRVAMLWRGRGSVAMLPESGSKGQ